jgi:hypothetical protein
MESGGHASADWRGSFWNGFQMQFHLDTKSFAERKGGEENDEGIWVVQII